MAEGMRQGHDIAQDGGALPDAQERPRRGGRGVGMDGDNGTRSRPPRSSQRAQEARRALLPISIERNASQSHEKPLRRRADGDRGTASRREPSEGHRARGEATMNASHGPGGR